MTKNNILTKKRHASKNTGVLRDQKTASCVGSLAAFFLDFETEHVLNLAPPNVCKMARNWTEHGFFANTRGPPQCIILPSPQPTVGSRHFDLKSIVPTVGGARFQDVFCFEI